MGPEMIAALTPLLLAIFAGIGWIVRNIFNLLTTFKEENDQQHKQVEQELAKLTLTTVDTNRKIDIVTTDVKHISKQVDRNSEYIDQRRRFEGYRIPPRD